MDHIHIEAADHKGRTLGSVIAELLNESTDYLLYINDFPIARVKVGDTVESINIQLSWTIPMKREHDCFYDMGYTGYTEVAQAGHYSGYLDMARGIT